MELLAILAIVALFGSGSSSSSSSAAASWTVTIGGRSASIMRRGEMFRWATTSASGSAESLHAAIVAFAQQLQDFTSRLELRSSSNEYAGTITPSYARNADGLPLSFAWVLREGTRPADALEFFGDAQFRATALSSMLEQLERDAPALV